MIDNYKQLKPRTNSIITINIYTYYIYAYIYTYNVCMYSTYSMHNEQVPPPPLITYPPLSATVPRT